MLFTHLLMVARLEIENAFESDSLEDVTQELIH